MLHAPLPSPVPLYSHVSSLNNVTFSESQGGREFVEQSRDIFDAEINADRWG